MDQPQDVLGLFAQAWADRDAGALADLFVEDAEFVNVVGLWWHNRADIQTAHAYGFEVIFGHSRLSFVQERSRMIGHSAAVVHGKWMITGQMTASGEAAGTRYGIFTFVLERGEGGWKVVAAHNTDVINGAESIAVIDGSSTPSDYR